MTVARPVASAWMAIVVALLLAACGGTSHGGPMTAASPAANNAADGGVHWSGRRAITLPSAAGYLRSLSLVDASHWFVVSDTGIARTTDAGGHWGALPSSLPSSDYILTVEFQTVDTAWAEVIVNGAHPALALDRTTDGGVHWTRLGVPSVP